MFWCDQGDWVQILGFNFREAGALYAAWAGGVATALEAASSTDGSATIKRAGLIGLHEAPAPTAEEPKRKRHLQLVD